LKGVKLEQDGLEGSWFLFATGYLLASTPRKRESVVEATTKTLKRAIMPNELLVDASREMIVYITREYSKER